MSVVPTISKIFERAVDGQLFTFLETNNILTQKPCNIVLDLNFFPLADAE